jgi:hypothetical protein
LLRDWTIAVEAREHDRDPHRPQHVPLQARATTRGGRLAGAVRDDRSGRRGSRSAVAADRDCAGGKSVGGVA